MKSLKPDSHMMFIGRRLKWKWFQVVRCKAICECIGAKKLSNGQKNLSKHLILV